LNVSAVCENHVIIAQDQQSGRLNCVDGGRREYDFGEEWTKGGRQGQESGGTKVYIGISKAVGGFFFYIGSLGVVGTPHHTCNRRGGAGR